MHAALAGAPRHMHAGTSACACACVAPASSACFQCTQEVTVPDVVRAIEEAAVPTAARCAHVEAELECAPSRPMHLFPQCNVRGTAAVLCCFFGCEPSGSNVLACRRTRAMLSETRAELEAAREASSQLVVNKARREAVEEQQRNPVLAYVERLAAAEEGTLKDFLPPMGAGQDTPRLFRTPGKVCKHFPSCLHRFPSTSRILHGMYGEGGHHAGNTQNHARAGAQQAGDQALHREDGEGGVEGEAGGRQARREAGRPVRLCVQLLPEAHGHHERRHRGALPACDLMRTQTMHTSVVCNSSLGPGPGMPHCIRS